MNFKLASYKERFKWNAASEWWESTLSSTQFFKTYAKYCWETQW